MNDRQLSWYPAALEQLLAREALPSAIMREVVAAMVNGQLGDVETAALLTALRMKGESGVELAAAADLLREQMICLPVDGEQILDTCGTGGDGTATFNISTATAIVAAACGVRIVKHGNRSVSSTSGSSDVLKELGIAIEAGPTWTLACLRETGLGFGFAPHCHPVLARLAPIRRQLRIRTLFNLIGPLANPAGAKQQLLGVGRLDLLDAMADAVSRLGTRRTILVTGSDGMDEVTLAGTTHYRIVEPTGTLTGQWEPADFSLPPIATDHLKVGSPGESAAIIRQVIDPRAEDGPARWTVLANVAVALLAAGQIEQLAEGVQRAAESIRAGQAETILEKVRQVQGGAS